MGISNPSASVPVVKLIKTQNPKIKEALVQLIEYHKINRCSCGIVSKGTVREFGEWVYESHRNIWDNVNIPLNSVFNGNMIYL
jgi:hypothetical protein